MASSQESVWMVVFLKILGISVYDTINGGQRSISLAKNPIFHDRSKHIDIQNHSPRTWSREAYWPQHVPTKEVVADILTKALPRAQHEYLAKANGIGLSQFFVSHHSACSRGGVGNMCIL